VRLIAAYSDTYANNQFRALQQFFKWLSAEDPERPLPNPMAGLKPPKVDEKIVPVFTDSELAALLGTCKGGGYEARRDRAILTLFRDTGVRLSELAGLALADISLKAREALVTGKGGKQRTVKFGYDSAQALDRYLRERARHRMAGRPALWLGSRSGGPMTPSGVYQMVCRRGEQAGVEVNPHKFRHNFSHSWLDKGCAEGDLMELNGWTSPQMLRRYGRSAASSRGAPLLRPHHGRVVTGGGAAAAPARVTCWGELRGERPMPGVLRVLVAGQSAGGIERAGDGWRACWYTADYTHHEDASVSPPKCSPAAAGIRWRHGTSPDASSTPGAHGHQVGRGPEHGQFVDGRPVPGRGTRRPPVRARCV